MAILTNPRHELFAQEFAKGKSASEAYTLAGYRPCRQNAARLTTKDDIQARLTELQSEAAKVSEVSVQSLISELEYARKRADSLDQIAASVKAVQVKAQIAGISEQRVRVTHETLEAPDGTVEDIAEWMAWVYEDHHVRLTEAEKVEFSALLRHWHEAIQNFLRPLKAKQINSQAQISPPARP
jgi:phage terminase small subunit